MPVYGRFFGGAVGGRKGASAEIYFTLNFLSLSSVPDV